MKASILLLFLFFPISNIFSQTLHGNIYDKTSNEPITGASIYFDGTTIGTNSELDGSFSLSTNKRINIPLFISFIGYKTVMIAEPYKQSPLKVYLEKDVVDLAEVEVRPDPFKRLSKLKIFRSLFLGFTEGGKASKILNEEDLVLYYDEDSKALIAKAKKPLIIENSFLAYKIEYNLVNFSARLRKPKMNLSQVTKSYYVGTPFIIDISEGKKKYKKRRRKVYNGSSLQLIRVMAKLEKDRGHFKFFRNYKLIDYKEFVKLIKTENGKQMRLLSKLRILYKGFESTISPEVEQLLIDDFGNHSPPNGLLFNGVMGAQKIGDLLPLDYGLK